MPRVTLVLYKRPHVGWDEFRCYWSDNHSELMASLPGVRKFVQCALPLAPSKGRPLSDEVAKLWFDSPAAMRSALESHEGQRIFADMAHGFDHRKLGLIVVEDLRNA